MINTEITVRKEKDSTYSVVLQVDGKKSISLEKGVQIKEDAECIAEAYRQIKELSEENEDRQIAIEKSVSVAIHVLVGITIGQKAARQLAKAHQLTKQDFEFISDLTEKVITLVSQESGKAVIAYDPELVVKLGTLVSSELMDRIGHLDKVEQVDKSLN